MEIEKKSSWPWNKYNYGVLFKAYLSLNSFHSWNLMAVMRSILWVNQNNLENKNTWVLFFTEAQSNCLAGRLNNILINRTEVWKMTWAEIHLYKSKSVSRWVHLPNRMGFPGGSDGRESACNAGDATSIPGLGRYPEAGNGNSLQYSCLGNPMDRGAWWAVVHGLAKSPGWWTD